MLGESDHDGCLQSSGPRQLLPSILGAAFPPRDEPDLSTIASSLRAFLPNPSDSVESAVDHVLIHFGRIESSTEKRQGRMALESAARELLAGGDVSSIAATVVVTMALALPTRAGGCRRTVASAICAQLALHSPKMAEMVVIPNLFRALFREANQCSHGPSSPVDWHIISALAKATRVTCLQDDDLAKDVAQMLRRSLDLEVFHQSSDDVSMEASNPVPQPEAVPVLALAAQLGPWQTLEPKVLVRVAIRLGLWQAAERICESATGTAGTAADSPAVETLLEGAFRAQQYRQADAFATRFFSSGGNRRYLEARYLHACGTIARMIRKGAIPIIDKQVDRIDKAAEKMRTEPDVPTTFRVTPTTAGADIRSFALGELVESGHLDAAHRLAKLWNVAFDCDSDAILAAKKARREKYLQWEDLHLGSPPDLISTPEGLVAAMHNLIDADNSNAGKIFGFDAEWSEDDTGIDVLQLANLTSVVLIDIPALSKTPEGVTALAETVGHLFSSAEFTKIGFGCRQDISKLRGNPTCGIGSKHWFSASEGTVDLKVFLAARDPKLDSLGLSRVCARYLGKPLDKSEQCSYWNARPLSRRQRTYAALDAWTVVAIYDKLQRKGTV